MVRQILVPRPGIEPVPYALKAQSLNHWTAREVVCITSGNELNSEDREVYAEVKVFKRDVP